MAKARREIDSFDDIDFQDEVEIICNFLRWDSFPKSGTENFKRLLEKRAQDFCVEAYIPTDDASPALPWQLFYTGSPESRGDGQVEYLQEVGEPQEGQTQSEGCKRLVIPHPRQQRNVLSKVHEGKEGMLLCRVLTKLQIFIFITVYSKTICTVLQTLKMLGASSNNS